MHINFYNSTDDGTLIAVIVLAVTFAGMLMICTTCEHYIISIQYYVPVLKPFQIRMHTTLYTGVCLCYLKQPCKSYKLFNKHNKGVELSDITSAENLGNSQNRYVKGVGFVCKMLS